MLKASDVIEQASVEPATYEVEIPNGGKIIVRRVADARVFEGVALGVQAILHYVKANRFPVEWKPYLPITERTAQMMVLFSEFIVEPKFTLLESLELIHKGGMFALHLYSKIVEDSMQFFPDEVKG